MIDRTLRDESGATAAEFAMVLPLLILLLFGIIDAGRLAWEYNRAEKATQVGVRVAVVTDSIPTGIRNANYVGETINGSILKQGDRIPRGALGEVKCDVVSCECVLEPCPAGIVLNEDYFSDVLLPRMKRIKPDIEEDHVELVFNGSGLGYAGDPNGMEIAPLVTVRLSGLEFKPITSLLFVSMAMPSFASTLTVEDALGTSSN